MEDDQPCSHQQSTNISVHLPICILYKRPPRFHFISHPSYSFFFQGESPNPLVRRAAIRIVTAFFQTVLRRKSMFSILDRKTPLLPFHPWLSPKIQAGQEFLVLLPETVPFVAEVMDDTNEEVLLSFLLYVCFTIWRNLRWKKRPKI